MNTQAPMAITHNKDVLQVTEIFHSIQGEGPFAGQSAIFIRLAGCNLQCPECDTKYPISGTYTAASIVASVQKLAEALAYKPIIVITGGEPFRQNIAKLVTILNETGFFIQIETNGTIYPDDFPWFLCTIVCSPKTTIHQLMLPRIEAFKYVAKAGLIGDDGLPTQALGMKLLSSGKPKATTKAIYLQPLDEGSPFKNAKNTEAVVESCLKHGYILCLQLHKIIDKE